MSEQQYIETQEALPVSHERPLSQRQEFFLPKVQDRLSQRGVTEGEIFPSKDTLMSSYLILNQEQGRSFIKCLQAEYSEGFSLPRPAEHLQLEQAVMTLLQKEGLPVVAFDDHWQENDCYFYSFPELEGGSLTERNRNHEPLSFDEYHSMAERVSSVLSFLHTGLGDRACYYRDLNSGNVLFNENGEAFLGDFGNIALQGYDIEYQVETDQGLLPFEMVSRSTGAWAYLAPESLSINEVPENNEKSDQYSLAVILYEALTIGGLPHSEFADRVSEVQGYERPNIFKIRMSNHGYAPLRSILEYGEAIYRGMSEQEILDVLNQSYDSDFVAKVAELDLVFGQALNPDPDFRFASVAEFYQALEAALQNLGESDYSQLQRMLKQKLWNQIDSEISEMETEELPAANLGYQDQEVEINTVVSDFARETLEAQHMDVSQPEIKGVRSRNIINRVIKALRGL